MISYPLFWKSAVGRRENRHSAEFETRSHAAEECILDSLTGFTMRLEVFEVKWRRWFLRRSHRRGLRAWELVVSQCCGSIRSSTPTFTLLSWPRYPSISLAAFVRWEGALDRPNHTAHNSRQARSPDHWEH